MEKFSMIENTIGDFLSRVAKEIPEHIAVNYPLTNYKLTYQELDNETDKLAKSLIYMGVKRGDHVAIWAHNVPEWILLLFATAKIGAVLVTVNTLYRAAELEYLLRQSDSTILFLVKNYKTQDYIETVYEILPELKSLNNDKELNLDKLPRLKRIIHIGNEKFNGISNFYELYKYAEFVENVELEKIKGELDEHDIINMQYTSGTTGFPKGVMLSHYNLLNNAYAIGKRMNFSSNDKLCIPVPFFHCFGLVLGILVCLTHKATMVPVLEFNPISVLKTVELAQCTGLHGVPTMFISLLNVLEREKFDIRHLRTGIMAGSNCPVEVMKQVIQDMNMKDITIVYGQTEASPGITQTKIDDTLDKRVETVGVELEGVEVKIVDPETLEECPPEVQGELWSKGYNVMMGYYKMPKETAEAKVDGGWVRTGDLAIKTKEGYYKITGRIKDMIIRGGENIYPREIEEFLYKFDKISDVQVVGIPDKKYGEEVMAFIIPAEGVDITQEEIKEFCKGKIADYKIPKYIEIVDKYPMTASGKIQKYKLREIGTKLINS
jgi:fatty-acyl-CoA synthase